MEVPGKTAHESFASTMNSLGSSEDYDIYCQPCDRNTQRLPAFGFCRECNEHICEACFKHHKRHTLSMHHNLLDKNNMPQTMQQPPEPVQITEPDDLSPPCQKHKKEVIKFYCHGHNALLCSVCITLEHSGSTCKVKYIPNISGQMIDSKEYQDILKDIHNIADQCDTISEDVKELTALSNNSLEDMMMKIKKIREDIIQNLDVLEKQTIDAAKAIQQENDIILKSVTTTCDDLTKSLTNSSDSIKRLNTSKQADRLFIELELAKQMVKDCEKTVQQISTRDLHEYSFQPNYTTKSFLENNISLGSIEKKMIENKICVSSSKDGITCRVAGMVHLPSKHLIIVDSNNNAIKMVDLHSYSICDQLQLDTYPSDVTSITSTELAVALPRKSTIQFVSASANNLVQKHKQLTTDGECTGISYYQGKLIVSFKDLSKLQILKTDGTVLKTVQANYLSSMIWSYIFRKPGNVKCSQNGIYISDCDMKRVVKLNWECEMIGSTSSMNWPCGISLTDDGSAFVCDSVEGIVEKISDDCTNRKVVLKGLKSPKSICWCSDTCTLYVSCVSYIERNDNFIHIFKQSQFN